MSTVDGQIIGCIGKCTCGLTLGELDYITDSINKTLNHIKGRKIFRKYLTQGHRRDDLACLDFYEMCCDFIDREESYYFSTREPTLEFLANDVNTALLVAEGLDGVPEIDMAILERFNEALTTSSRDAMLAVLKDTKIRLANHLENSHRGFKTYILQPCPKAK